jgi:hypothetical protein
MRSMFGFSLMRCFRGQLRLGSILIAYFIMSLVLDLMRAETTISDLFILRLHPLLLVVECNPNPPRALFSLPLT